MVGLDKQEALANAIGSYLFTHLKSKGIDDVKIKISAISRYNTISWKISTYKKKWYSLTIDRNFITIEFCCPPGEKTPRTVDFDLIYKNQVEEKMLTQAMELVKRQFRKELGNCRFDVISHFLK